MALAITAIRMVVCPHKVDEVRTWLADAKHAGDRVSYLEIPGWELRTFVVHGDSKVMRNIVKAMPGWGARMALS